VGVVLSALDPQPEARVAHGAQRLDLLWPGWWRFVNLDLLDMDVCARCVAGQLNEAQVPYDVLRLDPYDYVMGFTVDPDATLIERTDAEAFEYLGELWAAEIERRRRAPEVHVHHDDDDQAGADPGRTRELTCEGPP
jgi:hypothetical protein